jgi:dynein heavy chain
MYPVDEQSNDNKLYLKAISDWIAALGSDFSEVSDNFKPLMHTILLIWRNSKFYNTPGRLVVLMREICNQLIKQAVEYVNGPEMFEGEPEPAVELLKTALKVCVTFKSTYFDYKARASTECPSNPWRFQNSALFARLDGFLERCHDVLDLMQTIVQFNKLEKIEVGGTKGKVLTSNVQDIYQEFLSAVTVFKSAEYDIMDVENKTFDDDFYNFRCCINELERRLASIIVQAFDDSTTVLGCFKLFDAFEGLLEREIILSDLEKKNTDLLNSYADDLRAVQEIFMQGQNDPMIADNAPPHAGAVTWSRGLVERVEEPMTRLKGIGKSVLESEEGKEVVRAHAAIMASLREFEVQHVDTWCLEQQSTGAEKLKMHLLRREEGGEHAFLRVNFDPALICLLREVKYFLMLNIDIPESAQKIFEKNETFRQQTGNLDIIVNTYNKILETLLDVERPLLQARLDDIDKFLAKGIKSLTWKSPAINEFIQNTMTRVEETDTILRTIKDNVSAIQKVLQGYTETLMIDRNPTKTYTMDQWQEMIKKSIAGRYAVIEKGGHVIREHLVNSNEVLKVKNSNNHWRDYVDYVNDIVVSGLSDVCLASTRYLYDQVDEQWLNSNECMPLLEIQLKLAPPRAVYTPIMGRTAAQDGMRDITDSWLAAFANVATLVGRLDSIDGEGDYLLDMQMDVAVKHSISQTNKKIDQSQKRCEEFRDQFMSYSYLWTNDIVQTFTQWKEENRQTGEDVLDPDPPLSAFDAEIVKFKNLEAEIRDLPSSKVFGPFRIDAKPIKSSLASWVSKWTYQYQQYLLDKVTNNVANLDEFIKNTDVQLDTEVGENDRKAMLDVMGYLRDVRKRTAETDAMFEPLRQTVSLLAKHQTPSFPSVSEETLKLLEETPLEWNNLKKKAVVTKEKQAKSQSREADNLKKESKEFQEKVLGFYKAFKQYMPFEYTEDYDSAYEKIDLMYSGPNDFEMSVGDESKPDDMVQMKMGSVLDMQAASKNLNELQELFELYVIEYREIAACGKDATNIKQVWDVISMVQNIYVEWKKTKWDDINVEELQEQNKKLQKEVKGCDKVVKNWPCYKGLEDSVKNMQSSLPLVEELRSKAMRDRHWNQVMRACGVSFKMDDSFTFGSMLALELHKYEDDVLEIVDRATKELGIEKQLAKLTETWKVQDLSFPPDSENPDLCSLVVDETVMEALEDNSLLLQNLQSSKYVQGNADFLAKVQDWQKKLGMVDVVLSTWKEVQGKWGNLQSIFIGSADIRVQLPEDSKRFDGIDAQWKDLMKEAANETNAVLACNMEGRLESIEGMLAGLEKCEKALADYLETKRLAYPRFYFVAGADLLDILSKGSNPQLILKHLPKCFDNIKTLEFNKDDSGVPTKVAIGMYSEEMEYVPWPSTFTCEGAVETWLFNLTNHTHAALTVRCNECVSAFDEKPREQFIFDWCAQLVSVICRIVYTEDVNWSFDQLEEGNENAMRDYNKKQIDVLNKYAELILTDLTKNDRKKIIMLMTLDVHARDITQKLIDEKLETKDVFAWMSQLKFRTDEKTNIVAIDICDYTTYYGYEYIGNCGCLVVTPLTDRCYITLTQAMRLILGGAPAGPAGTGKTETTKDLGRALGVMVYVFNCSDQMDYKSMGQIFKGLSQAGAWGCFDEFNRIDISVLSVVSTQYKTILDAIRGKKARFDFEEENIPLNDSPYCCSFITMNPGYAGRTELPESVKALFRPCAMIVPDMDLICEIMLMSEGYSEGKVLARKFMMLYRLSEALLSAQKHYDWKLRAVKTTLNVAGGMLRADRQNTESRVLLRALRDFNLGKLVFDDVGIFIGMIDDLFPKQREFVERQRELDFEAKITEACHALQLQPEEIFLLKTSQLREIAVVRWSVFVLGSAGCGKSEMIRTLAKAQNLFGEKATINSLNPKSVTRNELYGYIHPATREWKDGLLSQIFRDLANTFTCKSEYLILDGDIDAEWIESMNTVMDDNKTLTLASNERIPLTAPMRLLLEIENMREASPATVSRGGVIFMNATDVGWMPFVVSWIANREYETEKTMMLKLFQSYPSPLFEWMRKNCDTIVPLPEICRIQHLCYILEGILGNGDNFAGQCKQMGPEAASLLLESYFLYALMWSIGGATFTDKQVDHRKKFHNFIKDEFKTIRFPEEGEIFDYCVEESQFPLQMKDEVWSSPWKAWSEKVDGYNHQRAEVFGNIYVATMETQRLSYLLDLLLPYKHAVMFVGGAGTGKTTIMMDKLRNIDSDVYASMNINMNCFTDSMLLQTAMESVLEKKTGRTFGPTGTKKMIYFIDDINMPQVDKYGTQQPIALMRQLFDYAGWYSRDKLTWRDIQNVQVISCLNPTAGSFYIDPRLQRSYCTYAVQMPGAAALQTIFTSILTGHFEVFSPEIQKGVAAYVNGTVEIQNIVANTFYPTAVKFHYIFNLRDVGNIFEGLLRSEAAYYPNNLLMARLWYHECERVFADRMISRDDLDKFDEILANVAKKNFGDSVPFDKLSARPIMYTSFTTPGNSDEEHPYCGIEDEEKLSQILTDKLHEYNETNAVMELVLFTMAIEHICRITRCLDKPRGNALLVGVGGSGKQSLSKLSGFICGYENFQITVTATYGMNDFKENMLYLYTRAGCKGIGTCFILTDGQIVNERMMVFLNDMLATGNIPDIFTKDVKDEFSNAVRNDCKQAGIIDTPENLWNFFIEKSRKYLHLCLCFSPVGDKFRIRARQFPALINCTTFDYFHPWPNEALISVAKRFISNVEGINAEDVDNVASHMAFVHTMVNQKSEEYLASERRYNYTTPKSYLDLISLYKFMLNDKKEMIHVLKDRLENGLEKMNSAAEQVAELQENLVKDMAIVEEKKEATDKLIVVVGQETNTAMEQKAIATVEEEKCSKIAEEVMAFQAECEKEMAAAEPIIQAAMDALDSLDKKSLTELKALASPPAKVDLVTAGVIALLSTNKVPKDVSWGAAKKLMGNVDQFLGVLLNFDKDNTPVFACEYIEKHLFTDPDFTVEVMSKKSNAAAGMCAWVINIVKYYRIYEVVEPKRQLLAEANQKLEAANTQLASVRAHVAGLEAKLAELNAQFEAATQEKNEAIASAEKTQRKADMATRLVNGLADENVRWTEAVKSFDQQEAQYVGDVLVASAFVSYIGAFNARFRTDLVSDQWLPDMIEKKVPMTEGIHPLDVLCDEAQIAVWNSQGLPSDSVSVQNGAIVKNCKRWPLLIDPQLQGIKWLRRKHTETIPEKQPEDWDEEANGPFQPDPEKSTVKEMKTVQLTQNKYLNAVEMAISNGEPIMIENIREEIDAVLEPVLMRSTIRRGKALVIKLGDKEVDYDPKFTLYIQTKLSNPHYKPEIAAQTTLLNFMITVDGLEEQLLGMVVSKERPDLEAQKAELIEQQNGFKLKLKALEDELLYRLSSSQGDILEDIELIEGLERAKVTATEIQEKQLIAKDTEKNIAEARKAYIPVAVRGALVYFLVDQLWVLEHLYRYSMANFVTIFKKGMDQADVQEEGGEGGGEEGGEGAAPAGGASELKARVQKLIETSCYTCFSYVAQGLFERHKLVFASQLCFQVQSRDGTLSPAMFDALIQGRKAAGIENPLNEWLDDGTWLTCNALKEFEVFEKLPDDMVGSAKRFREWFELERPEETPLPGDWKKLTEFEKLLLTRALRLDRMNEALSSYVTNIIGKKYVTSVPFNLERSYDDVTPYTPVFFILSPGVDPVKDTEKLGKQNGVGFDMGNFGLVSLGQGQEPVAERAIETSFKNGGWAFLQNIHLTPKWTGGYLEKRCDDLEGAHDQFRMFLSAEPAKLPINVLQVCVKLTNEPPQGLQPNVSKNWKLFSDDFFDSSAKPGELKSITFAICLFHAIVVERKKFGPQGWNRGYPFNFGDLTACAQVAMNYLENNPKIPWDDLRYIFGDIMYGGHVTDHYDRILVANYLNAYLCDELVEGFEIFPGCKTPQNSGNSKDILEHIDTAFPQESPTAFGLHPNAEIGYRLMLADTMFNNIRELQPRSGGGGGGMSITEKAAAMLEEITGLLPDQFDMLDILDRAPEVRTPYVNVFLQEIERMQFLMGEMKRSLAELALGLKGDLQITEVMESLMNALADGLRPAGWDKYGYPSKRNLASWVRDLIERQKQLSDWTGDMNLPKSTCLSYLFNPQSFLTAVMQTTARQNDWPLDKTVTQTDVQKKFEPADMPGPAKEGAYIHGLVLEGARWDEKAGSIEESRPKELFAKMPIVLIKAAQFTGEKLKDTYMCPTYKTQDRGPTFVFEAGLRSKTPASKWILAGVGLLMDVA